MASVVLRSVKPPKPRVASIEAAAAASTPAVAGTPAITATDTGTTAVTAVVRERRRARRAGALELVFAGTRHRDLIGELLGRALPEKLATAYTIIRPGAEHSLAFIPGHRAPRQLTADGTADGPPTRPPRRIVLTGPPAFVDDVHVIAAPARPATIAGAEILADAVRHADGLVYVFDAGVPMTPEQRKELAMGAAEAAWVLLVHEREVTAEDRLGIVRQVPAAADAMWLPVDDPALVAETLLDMSHAVTRESADADHPGPDASAPAAPQAKSAVAVSDDDVRWRAALERELTDWSMVVRRRLSADLQGLEGRCAAGLAALPDTLDAELHALSLRLTDSVERAARTIVRAVFDDVVVRTLTDPVLTRLVASLRQQIDGDDRIVVVTATAGAATVADCYATLSATGVQPPTLLPPIGAAVSGNCHLMWLYRGIPDKEAARQWLRHCVSALERELDHAIADRFTALGEAISVLAADAVDHGVLLA